MNTEVVTEVGCNITDFANIIMAIASVISLIISIVNVVIVIWVFKKERNDIKEKENNEKKTNWYNSLGIKEITISFQKDLNSLKDTSIKYLNNSINQDDYIKMYKETDEGFLRFKNEFITIVDCIDDSLVNKITKEFQEIQDEFYNVITTIVGDKSLNSSLNNQKIIISFDTLRKRIIKLCISIYN